MTKIYSNIKLEHTNIQGLIGDINNFCQVMGIIRPSIVFDITLQIYNTELIPQLSQYKYDFFNGTTFKDNILTQSSPEAPKFIRLEEEEFILGCYLWVNPVSLQDYSPQSPALFSICFINGVPTNCDIITTTIKQLLMQYKWKILKLESAQEESVVPKEYFSYVSKIKSYDSGNKATKKLENLCVIFTISSKSEESMIGRFAQSFRIGHNLQKSLKNLLKQAIHDSLLNSEIFKTLEEYQNDDQKINTEFVNALTKIIHQSQNQEFQSKCCELLGVTSVQEVENRITKYFNELLNKTL